MANYRTPQSRYQSPMQPVFDPGRSRGAIVVAVTPGERDYNTGGGDPPPAPAPTPDPSPPPPVTSGGSFSLLFDNPMGTDVGEGSFPAAVSTNWDAYPTSYSDTRGAGYYDPRVISISGGVMTLNMRRETNASRTRVAAPVPKYSGGAGAHPRWSSVRYGQFEYDQRIVSADPGFKCAWLLWPDSRQWPRDGEIDYPEKDLTTNTVRGFMHRQDATVGSDQYATPMQTIVKTNWNTYRIEWTPNLCQFFLNGTMIGSTTLRVPNTPMHLVFQTETVLHGPTPLPGATAVVQLRNVRIWKYVAP